MRCKLLAIVNHFGKPLQWLKLPEECGEVCKAVYRYELNRVPNTDEIIEEIADVQVVLEEMKAVYNISEEQLTQAMQQKIERTLSRYNINIIGD